MGLKMIFFLFRREKKIASQNWPDNSSAAKMTEKQYRVARGVALSLSRRSIEKFSSSSLMRRRAFQSIAVYVYAALPILSF